ncbi:MAG: hypothetical protein U5K28_05970 [Halobacteriales archaeon]|nr:hypothetical protein [Halobacteriales archaeon]
MEFETLGDATGGPKLRLNWRRFSYAGKFVMTNTGKAIFRDGESREETSDDEVVG